MTGGGGGGGGGGGSVRASAGDKALYDAASRFRFLNRREREGGREGESEGGREGGRDGRREGGSEGGRRVCEGRREGGGYACAGENRTCALGWPHARTRARTHARARTHKRTDTETHGLRDIRTRVYGDEGNESKTEKE